MVPPRKRGRERVRWWSGNFSKALSAESPRALTRNSSRSGCSKKTNPRPIPERECQCKAAGSNLCSLVAASFFRLQIGGKKTTGNKSFGKDVKKRKGQEETHIRTIFPPKGNHDMFTKKLVDYQ